MTDLKALLDEGERLVSQAPASESLKVFELALSEAERQFGTDHDSLIMPLWWLSRLSGLDDDTKTAATEAAARYGRRAVELAKKFWSGKPQETAALLTSYSVVLTANEQLDDALDAARRAEGILLGIGSDVREQLHQIVELLMFSDRAHEALPDARRLLLLETNAHGILLWRALYLALNCLRMAGQDEEALTLCRQFLALEGKGAPTDGWKDEVRPMVEELEKQVRSRMPGG